MLKLRGQRREGALYTEVGVDEGVNHVGGV